MAETPTPRHLPVVQARDLTPDPVFERIGIVGLGLIGGSIALAARERWPRGLIVAVDRKDVLEQAMSRHVVDVAAEDLGVLSEVDVIVLAAPVRQNLRVLGRLPDHIARSVLVTDVGSTKQAIVEAAVGLPSRLTFIGGHPMAGAAIGGLVQARADLFTGRPWLLTPSGIPPAGDLERLERFVTGLGAEPHVLQAADHDRLLAFLSHLPQLAVSALMAVVGQETGDAGLGLAGRGLIDTTRLASSPAEVWRDITATNAVAIGRALDILIDRLSALRAGLDGEGVLEATFEEAARWRAALMKDRTS